jgi:hypothetical protein
VPEALGADALGVAAGWELAGPPASLPLSLSLSPPGSRSSTNTPPTITAASAPATASATVQLSLRPRPLAVGTEVAATLTDTLPGEVSGPAASCGSGTWVGGPDGGAWGDWDA